MFIGHLAVGLASKRLAPQTSLVLLLSAPVFLDLLWPIFLLSGVERVAIDANAPTPFLRLLLLHYPWSHSLLMAVAWSIGLSILASSGRAAVVVGAGVFSHWVLDFVTHRPDMQLYPGGSVYVGLGLWRSTWGTIVVECAMFVAGVAIYLSVTRPRNVWGHVSLWAFVALFLALYAGSIAGPPPPSVDALRIGSLMGWIVVPLAFWIEHTRTAR